MFAVVITTKDGDREYKHTQRKIAQRQFEQYKGYEATLAVALVHNTRQVDEVLDFFVR